MKIALGTAQFGMDYGVSNSYGKVGQDDINKILEHSIKNKITYIDTAPIYGDSEFSIGRGVANTELFNIVTKTPVFKVDVITEKEVQNLKSTFFSSLSKLKVKSVYALLIHNVSDIFKKNGDKLFYEMMKLKDSGFVKKIGVSVYSSGEIYKVLDNFKIDIIQLPVNILDQRLIQGGELNMLSKYGIEIHARSVFLQGLLLMSPSKISPYFSPIMDKLLEFSNYALEAGMTKYELALNFVQSIDEIDKIIIGVNSPVQLKQILMVYSRELINTSKYESLAVEKNKFLNPSLWKI